MGVVKVVMVLMKLFSRIRSYLVNYIWKTSRVPKTFNVLKHLARLRESNRWSTRSTEWVDGSTGRTAWTGWSGLPSNRVKPA